MDPSPTTYPLLSYVMSLLPFDGPAFNPQDPSATSSSTDPPHIVNQMPHLSSPNVLSSMIHAVSDVSQTRSFLQNLGPRPDHESVNMARSKLAEIVSSVTKSVEELGLCPRPLEVDLLEWRAFLVSEELEVRKEADKEKRTHKLILQLDEMHEAYEKLLKEAEQRLVKIYENTEKVGVNSQEVEEEVNEDVAMVLQETERRALERVELSGRRIRVLPQAFGKINGLLWLNLFSNQLKVIPEWIAGFGKLEQLNLASNLLESLPISIGLLQNLKDLNVSGNKLTALPDTISHCRSLVGLDVSFNSLSYLPTHLGRYLGNLQRLRIQLNKIRSLPPSIGEMSSLWYLDAHFNELGGLPDEIGRLKKLQFLDLSNNFTELRELPNTLGGLTDLTELYLSNNQICALPDTFGRLEKLMILKLEQNPLVVPPPEIVNQGVEAVKAFMDKRLHDKLEEEERKSSVEGNEDVQAGWLTCSSSWLKTHASDYLAVAVGAPKDTYLESNNDFI
ncbi:hypothetical protein Gogos_000804 [Gossypium gossypioides]|uniref:Disease resistance R13L4/SHOC-2-like LRR domain-containing protein n=1 Tax=Gossypium gossypioides TaxID=34282 RepID=A0A7J9CU02_GOSGO|nr:hypothetical protein [Gossypium gossypioides]